MLRLRPTVTAVSSSELEDLETRGRYRKFLYRNSHTTMQRDPGQVVLDLPFHIAPRQLHNVQPKEDSAVQDGFDTPQLEEAHAATYGTNQSRVAKHTNPAISAQASSRSTPSSASPPADSPSRSHGRSVATEERERPGIATVKRQPSRLSRPATTRTGEAEDASWSSQDVDGTMASTSRRDTLHQMMGGRAATPTRSRLSIYNDSLPQQSQPQTPLNLPESRHQSRLAGPSTAPARRPADLQSVRTRRPYISPVGMRGRGFEGLYGGSENVEDAH